MKNTNFKWNAVALLLMFVFLFPLTSWGMNTLQEEVPAIDWAEFTQGAAALLNVIIVFLAAQTAKWIKGVNSGFLLGIIIIHLIINDCVARNFVLTDKQLT